MSVAKRLLLVLAILIFCVGCDQTTKSVAKAYLSKTEAFSLLGGDVRLQIAKNYGAFLSLGSSLPEAWRRGLMSFGVGALLVCLLAYLLLAKPIHPIAAPAIALIVGGGLSNLIDRLRYGGYVVDFINVGVGPVRTGIFNLADLCILLGVMLMVFGEQIRRRSASGKRLEATRAKPPVPQA